MGSCHGLGHAGFWQAFGFGARVASETEMASFSSAWYEEGGAVREVGGGGGGGGKI